MEGYHHSRRRFLYNMAVSGLSIPLGAAACNTDVNPAPRKAAGKNGKLGIALVGLGNYAGTQLAPALLETAHCYLAGIVTGTSSKAITWKERYNIPERNIYNYDNFDSIADNPDIDIIYIVLPNSMHAEYTIRAANAGKHVICEKPMALSVDDCDRMIAACKKAGRQLSIGYRLHFEPHHLEMQRLGQQKVYGKITGVHAGFGFVVNNPSQWRLTQQYAGGGPLQDLGIYCIQGICYTTGMVPVAVTAKEGPKTDPKKFHDVEQSVSWEMEMQDGTICHGQCSYADNMNFLEATAAEGKFGVRPAFNYTGQRGYVNDAAMNFPMVNQQARQMDAFALNIVNNTATTVPGEMGKRDVKIIQAIYEAMRTGRRIPVTM